MHLYLIANSIPNFYNLNMAKKAVERDRDSYRNLTISLLSGTLDLIFNLEYIVLAILSDFDLSP
jgi:hypothetical protein